MIIENNNEKRSLLSKIGEIIGGIILIGVTGFILAFVGLFMSIFIIRPETMFLIPFLIGIYVLLLLLLSFKWFGWWKRSNGKKVFSGITALIVVAVLVFAIPMIYKQTVEKVDAEVDLHAYMPFEKGTKAVRLDEDSNLKIENRLPILDGATALYPVYAAFAQAVYPERSYHLYNSEVMANMTHLAYENLINGEVDIIFVAGPSKNQLEMAERAGKELKLTPIGKESFVFFVNSKNNVKGLTLDQIKGIYSGEINNWSEVGGKNNTIQAFQRPENSGSQTALQNLMGDTPIMDPPIENVIGLMGGIIDRVSTYQNYRNAIGYTFRYYSTEMVGNNKIRLLEINGVEPTKDTILSGEYPIASDFYAVTAGSENPHIDEFINWILSDQGQEIIEKTGYVLIGK